MSDGSRLRQSWYSAVNDAETHFKQLLNASSSSEWKKVSTLSDPSSGRKGKTRLSSVPELADVIVHRNYSKSGDDIYRLVLEVPTGDEQVSLEPWKAVLTTPELRQEWDPAVEESHLVELFDYTTRISKTKFSLGWPANPRDAVMISRSFHDTMTFIDISTSLPRSPDEPTYLRPSPPFVRSHVKLFAWCIQYIQPSPSSSSEEDQTKKRSLGVKRIRITCFWEHDLKALWGFTSVSGITQQLSTMTLSLLKTVMKRGGRIPKLVGYGNGISIERVRFQIDREALTIDYSIVPEDDEHSVPLEHFNGMDNVHLLREQRRLTRSIECLLPSPEGWDVQVSLKASSEEVEQLPWSSHAIRNSSHTTPSTTFSSPDQIILRLTHSALGDDHSVLKVRVVIEVSGGTRGLRLNGLPKPVFEVEERDPSSYIIPQRILQDIASAADLSFNTTSSLGSMNSAASASSSTPILVHPLAERTPAAGKSILSRVRRNYIYFSSLLQEPEAKWRRTTEARGVSITQLDSIDPTLVVYRAEATFVGVSLWDLFGAVTSPGARSYWDKQHEDAVLLEDVNELTELWHFKTKPAWPVNGRDAVVLKTVYKSPTTMHVFAFSADDSHLFPDIPPSEPNIIRTQVDLQGWAIEALSPTTTSLTLLEQSDPKGWTNKTSIPTQMINTLAGIGEFAIKCGGPPIVTRLAGAKVNDVQFDHERANFRVEYEASASRCIDSDGSDDTRASSIECEIRCDIDTWASSLDIVVDPPPQSISCLRRHRLSSEGGGLWLTLTHDATFVDDERLLVIVRRAPGKERGLVMVNGAKVQVDVEEIPEHEIKTLTKQKRVKPPRIPLDQPPVMGVIRRRKAEWNADEDRAANGESSLGAVTGTSTWASAPRMSSPLTRFWTYAVDQATTTTQQAVAAISPASAAGNSSVPSPQKQPMQYALEALAWTQNFHMRGSTDGWVLVSDKGVLVQRKMVHEISSVIPVHKGSKVIEGVSAEELASIVQDYDCRRQWDDRFDSAKVLQAYGGECRTSFLVSKGGFPFRDRGFYLASVMARGHVPPSLLRSNSGDVAEHSNGARNAIFYVSASFSADSVASFSPAKYNPYVLPIGRVYVDAWILETLDPYTKENYAIPSTRCTRLVAVDFAGSLPAAVNSMINAALPRSILTVETFIKSISPLPVTRLPCPGIAITEHKGDEHLTVLAWKLKRRDDSRVFVGSRYAADEKVYVSTVLVTMPSLGIRLSGEQTTTPRPSRIMVSPSPLTRRITEQGSGAPDNNLNKEDAVPPESMSPTQPSFPSPPQHQRVLSSSGTTLSDNVLRGRSSSSAFTLKGEIKPSTDLLVAELVIDSKLYPDGYMVNVRSKMRSSVKVGTKGQYISLQALVNAERSENVLPLNYTIHTMPSSPLHSSGLNPGSPSRHLLRLSLPTAQYQISTVKDPLTGETRTAPEKPAWLLELQQEGGGAVVDIVVRPSTGKGTDKGVVLVDDKEIAVVSEKESLTTVGREELLDDKASKMLILSRVPNEAEPLPDGLKVPIAIAADLCDPSGLGSSTSDGQDMKPQEERGASVSESSEDSPGTPSTESPSPHGPHAPSSHSGGLLGFWHAYPNPLTRFTTSSLNMTLNTDNNGNSVPTAALPSSKPPRKLPGGLVDIDASPIQIAVRQRAVYPMSTLLIVALISFLIGSLLRSLLSPADFIYVVTDLREAEEANNVGGWREIRRLFELKYVFGGWDFQVAVVRRH